MERLIAHARTLVDLDVPVVLAGDFNVVPTNRDIYNAGAWRFDAVLQPQTRDAWQRLLAQGWTDATRHVLPEARVYTFWVNDDAFRRDAGFRMDFLLLNPSARAAMTATGIDREHRGRAAPSDHTPVWVTLGLTR
jgi:exodeoxyribonuclease-3